MSSTYRAICLSHDPGLMLDHPETSSVHEIEDWVSRSRREHYWPGHERCDLVAGRYSYPLVEVFCPGGVELSAAAGAPPRKCSHADGWLPIELLRAIALLDSAVLTVTAKPGTGAGAAIRAALVGLQDAAGECWTSSRIRRLLNSQE